MSHKQHEQTPPTAGQRAAELLPVTVPWGSPAVRERLWVDGQGALRWTAGTGAPVVLAGPGDILGVRLAQALSTKGAAGFLARMAGEGPQSGPLLVVDRRDGGPVVVALDGWWGAGSHGVDSQLTQTGARALLAALGRDDAWTFDVGTSADTELTGRPRVLDPRRTVERQSRRALLAIRWSAVLGILALGVAKLAWAVSGDGGRRPASWVLALFTLCSLVPIGATWWERHRAKRLPEPAAGALRVDVSGPEERDGWLERSPDNTLTVLRDGDATVLPGAQAGGVTRATALVLRDGTTAAVLLIAGSNHVAALSPRKGLTPESRDQVRDLVTAAGVNWDERTVPSGSPELSGLASAPRPSPWDVQVGLLGGILAFAIAVPALVDQLWWLGAVNLATLTVAVVLTREAFGHRR